MVVLLSISAGMDDMMSKTMNEVAGGIAVYPADAPVGFIIPGSSGFPISYAEDIEEVDHVEEVVAQIVAFIPTEVADFGDPMGVGLRGIDIELDAKSDGPTSPAYIIEGRTIKAENEILLGSMVAAFATGELAEVGGTIVMPAAGSDPITLTVVGIFEAHSNVHDTTIYSDLETARSIVPGLSDDEVNMIHITVDDTENVEAVSKAVVAMFEEEDVPVQTMIASDMLGSINESMSVMHSFMWIISLVAAIAGGISIFIVMLISVIERTKEFGILKASGWSNRNVISSVVVESLTVALLGAAAGLGIGYGGGKAIDAYLTVGIALVTWELVLIITAFGITMGVVGGLYPALRAARVSPIESMRAI